MRSTTLLPLVTVAVTTLVACGGGGGESTGSSGTTTDPLNKYIGTHRVCDRNEMITMVISSTGYGSVTMSARFDYHQSANCSGPVVGSETSSAALSATFVSSGPATVTGFPSANSSGTFTVDRLSISAPARITSLTGTGVYQQGSQTCVRYDAGSTCGTQGAMPAFTEPGGLMLTDQALVLLVASGNIFERDISFPRQP